MAQKQNKPKVSQRGPRPARQRAFEGFSLRNADVFDNPTRAQNHKVLVAEAAA